MIGKMKDETAGVAIKEFVRLKPEMSSHLEEEIMRIKKQRA